MAAPLQLWLPSNRTINRIFQKMKIFSNPNIFLYPKDVCFRVDCTISQPAQRCFVKLGRLFRDIWSYELSSWRLCRLSA